MKPKKIVSKEKETRKSITEYKAAELEAPKKLKLLFTVVNRQKAEFFMDALEGFDVNYQNVLFARGTASTEMMHHLGITDNSKAVIISIVKEEKMKEIIAAYEEKYFKLKGGKGVAFSVPMDSIIGVMAYRFLADIREE